VVAFFSGRRAHLSAIPSVCQSAICLPFSPGRTLLDRNVSFLMENLKFSKRHFVYSCLQYVCLFVYLQDLHFVTSYLIMVRSISSFCLFILIPFVLPRVPNGQINFFILPHHIDSICHTTCLHFILHRFSVHWNARCPTC
jgi:hypothetical protein